MKRFIVTFVVMALTVMSSAWAFSDEKAQGPVKDEIALLKAEITDLRSQLEILRWQNEALTLRLLAPRLSQASLGIMPIENWGWGLPYELRQSLRQVIVSAFREAGLSVTESLDETTLNWVKRQAELVSQGWIDIEKAQAPQLRGVSYLLIPTITSYQEVEVEDVANFGPIIVRFGDYRRRTGRLVMDFRLVDTVSGVAVDSFSAEAKVESRRYAAGTWNIVITRQEQPLPERVAREVARQAAERIAKLFNQSPPPPPSSEPKKKKEG